MSEQYFHRAQSLLWAVFGWFKLNWISKKYILSRLQCKMSVSGSAAIQMFLQQEKMHEDLVSCITMLFILSCKEFIELCILWVNGVQQLWQVLTVWWACYRPLRCSSVTNLSFSQSDRELCARPHCKHDPSNVAAPPVRWKCGIYRLQDQLQRYLK